jgi:hypothetical protein
VDRGGRRRPPIPWVARCTGQCPLGSAHDQSTNPPIHQSTNPPIHQSTNPPIHQSTNPPIHQSNSTHWALAITLSSAEKSTSVSSLPDALNSANRSSRSPTNVCSGFHPSTRFALSTLEKKWTALNGNL